MQSSRFLAKNIPSQSASTSSLQKTLSLLTIVDTQMAPASLQRHVHPSQAMTRSQRVQLATSAQGGVYEACARRGLETQSELNVRFPVAFVILSVTHP